MRCDWERHQLLCLQHQDQGVQTSSQKHSEKLMHQALQPSWGHGGSLRQLHRINCYLPANIFLFFKFLDGILCLLFILGKQSNLAWILCICGLKYTPPQSEHKKHSLISSSHIIKTYWNMFTNMNTSQTLKYLFSHQWNLCAPLSQLEGRVIQNDTHPTATQLLYVGIW